MTINLSSKVSSAERSKPSSTRLCAASAPVSLLTGTARDNYRFGPANENWHFYASLHQPYPPDPMLSGPDSSYLNVCLMGHCRALGSQRFDYGVAARRRPRDPE